MSKRCGSRSELVASVPLEVPEIAEQSRTEFRSRSRFQMGGRARLVDRGFAKDYGPSLQVTQRNCGWRSVEKDVHDLWRRWSEGKCLPLDASAVRRHPVD